MNAPCNFGRKIRVAEEDIRVNVMADRVLVVPRGHIRASEEIHQQSSCSAPPDISVAEGKMGAVVHRVQQWQSLKHSIQSSKNRSMIVDRINKKNAMKTS